MSTRAEILEACVRSRLLYSFSIKSTILR